MSPRVRFLAAAFALAALQLALTNYFVPLRAVFSHARLTGDDYDLHAGQVARVVAGLRDFGHSWVYDVKLVAGQPEGTITDAGSKGWELWTYALTALGCDEAVAFNCFVLLVMLIGPLLIYFAARSFELAPGPSLLACAMTSSLWFFDSFIHWLWFIGMVSYTLATCLGVLTLGLFFQLIARRRTAAAVPCALGLGIAHLVHPYVFFALAPPIAVLYLREFRALPRSLHLAVVGCVAFTLAINAFWLANARAHWHYILDSGFYAQGRLEYLLTDFLGILRNGGDTGVIAPRSAFRVLYFGLACAGLFGLRRERDPRLWPLAIVIGWSLALAYLASAIPFAAQIQPYRHLAPACFYSTIPAAAFVASLVREGALRGLSRGARALAVVCGVLIAQHLAIESLYFLPRLIPETEPFSDGSPSSLSKYGFLALHQGPTHVHYGVPHDSFIEIGVKEVIAWLNAHAAPGERILVEGNMLGERIAWQTELEVMGGFIERNVTHAYANYFRRYAKAPPDPNELGLYLRTFAISFVVTFKEHPELEHASGLLAHVADVGGRRIYRTQLPIARVLRGGGTVHASVNRLEVRGSDPNTPLLLSYHFHEALRCKPDCRVEREAVELDRVGFVRVPSPHPSALVVYNSYE